MTIHHTTKELVKETVVQTLLSLGIDVSEPESVVHFQKDMHYLREVRLREKSVQNKTLLDAAGMVVSAIGAAIILGVVSIVKGN